MEGEDPIDAAWRELFEETGLGPDDVEAVAEYPAWVVAEYPPSIKAKKGRLGQVHKWFLFDAVRDGVEPVPDGDEFVAWQWVTREWIVRHTADFRQPGYLQVLSSL